MCHAAWLVAALLASICAAPARAQDTTTDPERRAYELFRQSEAEYRAGRFAAAVALLEEAYRLDAEPVLVYNLARAYEGMGDLERAIDAYRRYLSDEPNARDRGAIEARLGTLTRQLEERRALDRLRQQREVEDPDRRDPRPDPDRDDPRVDPERDQDDRGRRRDDDTGDRSALVVALPWIVAGVGVAGIATGAVLGSMADARHDDAVAEPGFFPAMELQQDAEGLATGANVAFVVGGVVLAGGLTWAVLTLVGGSDDGRSAPGARATARARMPASIGVAPDRDGARVFLHTSWP